MIFQESNALSNGGCRQILRPCGTSERAEFGDADEAPEMANVQGWEAI